MSKINIRSPYLVGISALTSAKIDLYIYTGTQTTSRGAITYSLESTAYDDYVKFDISELIKDYLTIEFNGRYESQTVWVDYQITTYVGSTPQTPLPMVQKSAFYGYGYFEDKYNPQLNEAVLMSNDIVYKLDDRPLIIPIDQNNVSTVTFLKNGNTIYTENITPTPSSYNQIRYITNGSGDIGTYKDRVLYDGGTFEGSKCLNEFMNTITLYPVDTVLVDDKEIKIVNVEECKHKPYKLIFINKFGAFQDLWFFKKSSTSLDVVKSEYKSNIAYTGIISYNVDEHQKKILKKQGSERLTLNSGFVDEQYNEVFRQLMLSDSVWIEMEVDINDWGWVTLPVNVLNSSLDFKTSVNDGLINYTVNLEFAFDKINNVR